ncbi:alpha/beta hydrolase [Pseudorhodoferax sp.]|uniref:alpha/beta hydrolase n=1 Tax=Pseudorhodoferax sp. TaxID=1993553 RepID=UPI002DD64BA3|nr:alpha/beta hydrolase [Pseudorhodoferax sp.]
MQLDAPTASGSQLLDGPAGALEVVFDLPATAPVGIAVVTHPQPLLGGHAQHKVPQLLARALCEAGWLVARPNFRGVGRSAGTHDAGQGETEDVLALCQALRVACPGLRLALLGFSFGAFVQARVARALMDTGQPAWRVGLAGMPFGTVESGRRYDTPDGIADALVVQGERDTVVPLSLVFDWARPSLQPVVVVPGADHFFTGKLPVLRRLMLQHLNP